MTEVSATYICSCCLQENEIIVDITEGPKQTFTEDCTVCCRPNVLHIFVDEETHEVNIESEFEG